MAFGTYKTLGEVGLAYNVSVRVDSFVEPIPFPVPERLPEYFRFVFQHLDVQMSEAAVAEFLIAPVLFELWRAYSDSLQLWSHVAFGPGEGLIGVPDYYFSRTSPLGMVQDQPPYVLIVDAKKDDFDGGWAECLAAMLAAQKLNGMPPRTVFGCVSNGEVWQFGKLCEQVFVREYNRFVLSDLPGLFAAWNYIFSQAKAQARLSAA